MHPLRFMALAAPFLLAACNGVKTLNDPNFTQAISEYLAKHNELCTVIARQFPIDVSMLEQKEQYGIAPKLAALEEAGLVRATHTMAAVQGMLDPLRGAGPAQLVKQYELTAEGRKYFQQIAGAFGQTRGFCYGQKNVDAIIRWAEPVKSQAEVTYTYKIVNLADWAERPGCSRHFPTSGRQSVELRRQPRLLDCS